MKKTIKWTVRVCVCAALVCALVWFGPTIQRMLSNLTGVRVSSVVLSRELTELGVLTTLTQEETGEFVSEVPALVIGVAQRVSAPYAYHIDFGVDMEQAGISVNGGLITVTLPGADVTGEGFEVTGEVKKIDFLYPLTAERWEEIMIEQKQELRDTYDTAEMRGRAWDVAADKVRAFLMRVLDTTAPGYQVEVVRGA